MLPKQHRGWPRVGLGSRRFGGRRPPKALVLFFNARGLIVPGHLLGQRGVAGGQFLEALMPLHARHNAGQVLAGHALAVVLAVLAALQKVIGALDDGLAGALDGQGLLAEMAANELIDLGHLLEEERAFLLEGGVFHKGVLYILYAIE